MILSGARLTDEWMRHREIQYSEDEAKAVRCVTNEMHVYNPSSWDQGIAEKLRLEGITSVSISPGRAPSVAAFVAEKKVSDFGLPQFTTSTHPLLSNIQGAPASVKIHSLLALASPSCSKTFYKADKIQMKWNKTGSNLLFLTQTDVDKTGKSYYGETNLYLMNAAGQFDCRVTLGTFLSRSASSFASGSDRILVKSADKEGGIHDFAWSPNDREFAVTYGCTFSCSFIEVDVGTMLNPSFSI